MTSHFTPPSDRQYVGGAPVGLLAELEPAPMLAVLYLRVWCDDGIAAVERDFALALGETQGNHAATTFGALCRSCMMGGRRPIMRHQTGCRWLGGDEACFAQLLTEAATGSREDALMLAMLMVRADHAPELVDLAQQSGLALHRMILRGRPAGQALH